MMCRCVVGMLRKQAVCAVFGLFLLSCADSKEPESADSADDPCGPTADLRYAGRTAGSAAKTGGTTAVEGVKTVGKTVGGWFDEGHDGAEAEWEEGSAHTSDAAKKGAAQTKAEANAHPCR